MSIFCSPASPCDTIAHTYSQAGTYTVTASGRAGGTAGLSGTTQVVVGGAEAGHLHDHRRTPPAPTVGQNVIFVLSPTVSQSGDTITITFGDGQQYTVGYPCTLGACGAVHAYSTAGIYTVSASGTAGGAPVSGSTTVVVGGGGGGGTLTITPSPANPTVGQNVIFVLSPTVSQSWGHDDDRLRRRAAVHRRLPVPARRLRRGTRVLRRRHLHGECQRHGGRRSGVGQHDGRGRRWWRRWRHLDRAEPDVHLHGSRHLHRDAHGHQLQGVEPDGAADRRPWDRAPRPARRWRTSRGARRARCPGTRSSSSRTSGSR